MTKLYIACAQPPQGPMMDVIRRHFQRTEVMIVPLGTLAEELAKEEGPVFILIRDVPDIPAESAGLQEAILAREGATVIPVGLTDWPKSHMENWIEGWDRPVDAERLHNIFSRSEQS